MEHNPALLRFKPDIENCKGERIDTMREPQSHNGLDRKDLQGEGNIPEKENASSAADGFAQGSDLREPRKPFCPRPCLGNGDDGTGPAAAPESPGRTRAAASDGGSGRPKQQRTLEERDQRHVELIAAVKDNTEVERAHQRCMEQRDAEERANKRQMEAHM